MQTFPAIRSSDVSSLPGAAFSIPRNKLPIPKQLFFCRAKFVADESGNAGSQNIRVVPANLVVAEKEEAKAVLSLFLKEKGLSKAVAARTIKKSELFLDHLVSRLHSVHKTRYLVGRELTTLEIRDALNPYLETLSEEFGDILVDVVEKFPNPPIEERPIENLPIPAVEEGSVVPVSDPITTPNSKKSKALARLTEDGPTGKLPPQIIYLIELGMKLEVIKEVTRKFPAFAYYSLDGKIKPVVEFLIDLGVPKSDIPSILSRRPQICGVSLSQKIIPTMAFLENLGVDKEQWAKVIYRFPALLTYSRQKVKSTVDFLYEMGLSTDNVSKVLTRWPHIVGYSVEDNLRATGKYFHSMGIDVGNLLHRSPQTFGLSIEANLKPVTQFFLDKGFSIEDIASMVTRYGILYTFSLSDNMMPKWEFFLTMCYPRTDLVKFPQYFGYSLEERIKPRYATMTESGVRLILNSLLSSSESDFHKLLQRKIKKNAG